MLFKMIYQPVSRSFTSLQPFIGKECNVHSFKGNEAVVTFDGIDKIYTISIYDLVPLSYVKEEEKNKSNIDPKFKSSVQVKDKFLILNEEKTQQPKKRSRYIQQQLVTDIDTIIATTNIPESLTFDSNNNTTSKENVDDNST